MERTFLFYQKLHIQGHSSIRLLHFHLKFLVLIEEIFSPPTLALSLNCETAKCAVEFQVWLPLQQDLVVSILPRRLMGPNSMLECLLLPPEAR